MSDIDASSRSVALAAIERVAAELELEPLKDIVGDYDIFAAIDSFAIVELLMTTEAQLEEVTGTYVPLADEKIFDAEHSPLRSSRASINYTKPTRAVNSTATSRC